MWPLLLEGRIPGTPTRFTDAPLQLAARCSDFGHRRRDRLRGFPEDFLKNQFVDGEIRRPALAARIIGLLLLQAPGLINFSAVVSLGSNSALFAGLAVDAAMCQPRTGLAKFVDEAFRGALFSGTVKSPSIDPLPLSI